MTHAGHSPRRTTEPGAVEGPAGLAMGIETINPP
jgi:hypothetical protein